MRKIYITVDVECHNIALENNYIWGKVGEEEFGIRRILEKGKEQGIPINFFFDMCEANRYGEEYAQNIISVIQEYNQPVYLHLHPNYISGDDTRSFLWQYSYQEQYNILQKGFAQYYEVMQTDNCKAFRVGRYGASPEMYQALSDLNISVIDLSYSYDNPNMCHFYHKDAQTINRPIKYNNQILLPNTRFVCFDYFGKKKSINTDLHEIGFREFKEVLDKAVLDDIVLTMHSWHFINRCFYKKGISGDKKQLKKFDKIIKYCKRKGFIFADVGQGDFFERLRQSGEPEQEINNCRSFWEKVKSLFYNFFRFQEIGKINKKYFLIFFTFHLVVALGVLGILLGILL